jgi:hypothetical protein
MTISIAPPIQSGFSTLITSDEIAHLFADPGSAPEPLETIAPLSTRRELASVGGLTDSALPEVTKTRCDRGH